MGDYSKLKTNLIYWNGFPENPSKDGWHLIRFFYENASREHFIDMPIFWVAGIKEYREYFPGQVISYSPKSFREMPLGFRSEYLKPLN